VATADVHYSSPLTNGGITIDAKLSFNHHIDVICKKVISTLSFLSRNFSPCQQKIKADLSSLFFDYSVSVWAPHTNRAINQLNNSNIEVLVLLFLTNAIQVVFLTCCHHYSGPV